MIAAYGEGLWTEFAGLTQLIGGCAAVTAAAAQWSRRRHPGTTSATAMAALITTGLWSLAVAVEGAGSFVAALAMCLRNLAYLAMLFRLFSGDGRHTSVAPVRPVVVALTLVNLMIPLVVAIEHGMGLRGTAQHFKTVLSLLEVVGSLVLVHNLYAGASKEARLVLRWPAIALGAMWVFELNLYTVAYLSTTWPSALAALHGLVVAAFAIVLMVGSAHQQNRMPLRASRTVTFRSFSLLLIGGYLVGMVAVSQWLAVAGGDHARWLQFTFLIVASAAALLGVPSRRMRGWMRVMIAKHLFQHRYDYRVEWLRFTRTISSSGEDAPALQQRAIQALADITDSPAGLLLVPDDQGELVLAARWQWPTADVPARAFPLMAAHFLERADYIVELDDLRKGGADATPAARDVLPEWLAEETQAWALVPLLHFDRLIGAVVLARPAHARRLDWEDFDLLRVVGQQLATYLAEHASQQALIEAGRFDDFHRRIAFVMHDIKNLASQFSLLAHNAERHAENPAFRADMLVTLRNSADKLNALVARLSRYGGQVDKVEPVALGPIARAVAAQFKDRHPVTVLLREDCIVSGNAHSIEQMLVHLVQNAVDASAADQQVFIAIASDGLYASLEVSDSGCGMSAEFVRGRLFRPFDSSKAGGFGIGAYEARALAQAMNGRLEVESREGVGTRFAVRLPLISAAKIMQTIENSEKVA